MQPKHYRVILQRELKSLIKEVESYAREEDLWIKTDTIPNSAGNLVLHLMGSLKTYLGDHLGGETYARDKALEFRGEAQSRSQLLQELNTLLSRVENILDPLDAQLLDGQYPVEVEGANYPTQLILFHVLAHFSYHLGQINFHRRLLSQDGA